MTAFRWIEGASGEVVADGKRLEAVAYGPPPDEAPTIVMLHEGLGCVALWRDFPARLAAASWLPGGGRCGFRHRVLAFPDVHFARSAGTLRQPEVELNPKIKAHA